MTESPRKNLGRVSLLSSQRKDITYSLEMKRSLLTFRPC